MAKYVRGFSPAESNANKNLDDLKNYIKTAFWEISGVFPFEMPIVKDGHGIEMH